MKTNTQVIVVVGPTASGKSDFAVDLALKNNGEIISADSRQIYKGLDIGTGKITKKEMQGVVHHMLDVSNLNDEFSVSEYKRLAEQILKDILARGKTPIICGGTGQYIDSLIFDTSIPAVPPNKKLREKLEKKTTEELYKELLKLDKRRAKNIDKHNRVRLIRALEIINTIGKVPKQNKPKLKYKTEMYILSPSRELLRKRITKRLEKRLKMGMINEVKNLVKYTGVPCVFKKFGIEYVAIGKYLEGEYGTTNPTSLESYAGQRMKEEIITKSMRYAKRQETWNKKYLPIAKIIKIKK